jgi:hypothetical protein
LSAPHTAHIWHAAANERDGAKPAKPYSLKNSQLNLFPLKDEKPELHLLLKDSKKEQAGFSSKVSGNDSLPDRYPHDGLSEAPDS